MIIAVERNRPSLNLWIVRNMVQDSPSISAPLSPEIREELLYSAEFLRALADMLDSAEEEASLPCFFLHFLSPNGKKALDRKVRGEKSAEEADDEMEGAAFQVSPSNLQAAYLDSLERAAATYIGRVLAVVNRPSRGAVRQKELAACH